MTFPVLGGNSAVATYQIDNSLRFNDDDSAYLSRTPASAGDRKTWTWSGWVKRGNLTSGVLFHGYQSSTDYTVFDFENDKLRLLNKVSNVNTTFIRTNALFRDPSAWYHVQVSVDTTQATSTNRVSLWVNGIKQTSLDVSTYSGLNEDYYINATVSQQIGRFGGATTYLDGYLAEVNFIDGQALDPTDFGEFDEDSGIWKPIEYTGSYGTNGFYLDFEDSGSLGADQSGNGNNFTPNNLASTDQTTDTPTNNFATLNPNDAVDNAGGGDYDVTGLVSEGNLDFKGGGVGTGDDAIRGTIGISSGKWYWESKITDVSKVPWIGISDTRDLIVRGADMQTDTSKTSVVWDLKNGDVTKNGSTTSTGYTVSTNDIVGLAFDLDGGNLYIYKNGTALNGGSAVATGITSGVHYLPYVSCENGSTIARQQLNFGNPVHSISSGNSDDNGYGNFEYAPPSGYLALCTQNLATELSPTIDDGSQYFNTVLYTGTGVSNSVTGVGFQPDFVWEKARNAAGGHGLYDAVRGVERFLRSNSTDAEQNTTNGTIDSFDVDGFTLNADTAGNSNYSGRTYVAWNWLAGGTGVTNTDGSITSTVSANTTAGFSIITWTGNATAGATVGHGLNQTPDVILLKNRDTSATNWIMYHSANTSAPETDYLILDSTNATTDSPNAWNDTAPTSSVFSVGVGGSVNNSGDAFITYCFHSVEGYSKFGSYTGNGSTDGTFVYTGFRPALIILKESSVSGDNWRIVDNKRLGYNQNNYPMYPSATTGEGTEIVCDMLSNGYKLRSTGGGTNQSGSTFIYMAFAENPFVSSAGVPVTAR